MAVIEFEGEKYTANADETVLECLIRHENSPPSACRSGLCHTCMMKAASGKPPESSQNGLKETLRHQNYFLPCVCVPTEDLTVILPGDSVAPHFESVVLEKTRLTPLMLLLRLSVPENFTYIAGQFLNVFRDADFARSYSIASVLTDDDYIELHIEKIESGKMTSWLFDELSVGDSLQLSEPLGECYYLPGKPDKSLLLIATGSGLAPIYGILKDALRQGHQGQIHVFHGSANSDKIYLVDELSALAEKHENLSYTPCLSRGSKDGFTGGRANDVALAHHKDLKDWRLYLCGHPGMVSDTKRKAYLGGASLNDIFSDPFEFSS